MKANELTYGDFTDEEILREAYSMLDEVTPARFDCGKLCGSLCCNNASEDVDGERLGMWLLPGEKEFLQKHTDYTFVKDESGNDCAVCNGFCDRELRPFACRIYPYYASLSVLPEGRIMIKIKPDPRAEVSCPLVSGASHHRPSVGFVRAFSQATRLLLQRPVYAKELLEISSFLDEIGGMREKFFGKAK